MRERKKTPDSKCEGKERKKLKAVGVIAENSGDMVLMSLRLPESWRASLRSYFTGKGLDLSSGLRLWIGERMEQEGLK